MGGLLLRLAGGQDLKKNIDVQNLLWLGVGPLLALLIFIVPAPAFLPPKAWLMLGIVVWMVSWWLGERVPLAATALLPIPLLPLFDILPVKDVTAAYGHKFIFLFLGGFLLAGGMQRWDLHKRIALHVIARFGTGPNAIIAGFMAATAFLSMWISNTATTIMMYAVAVSLIAFLTDKSQNTSHSTGALRSFSVALLLGIAYAASIGGVGTLIGTGPNAFIASYLQDTHAIEIDFLDWMKVGVPVILVMVPCTYLLLTRVLFPLRSLDIEGSDTLIQNEIGALGAMGRGERAVLMVFVLAAFCWIFGKQISHITGFPLTDAGVAIGAALILFAWPVDLAKRDFVLTEKEFLEVPWGILILLGGGIALAAGMKSSGLAAAIGDGVADFGVTQWTLVGLAALMIVYLTELTSNTASTTTFVPVFGAIAVGAGLDPLLSTLPIAIGASMAFMMPVATPPNAIVFAYKELHVQDMVRAGFWLNIIAVMVCFGAVFLLAPYVFG